MSEAEAFIYSDLAQEDPDFAEIVEIFVDGLQDRLNSIKEAHASSDIDALKRLAHQLKGSGGGHGYPELTEKAASLEKAVMEQASADFQNKIDELAGIINRIRVVPQ